MEGDYTGICGILRIKSAIYLILLYFIFHSFRWNWHKLGLVVGNMANKQRLDEGINGESYLFSYICEQSVG